MKQTLRHTPILAAAAVCLTIVLGLLLGCSGKGTDGNSRRSAPGVESDAARYQRMQAELKLAAMVKPYLVINFAEKRLMIKLRNAVVWSYPLTVTEGDKDEMWDFVERFQGDQTKLIRTITETHLFAAQAKTPDSILAIISDATKFKPELLQRELPERFQLLWGDNVILDIHTTIKGKPTDKMANTIFEVRHALQTPFGKAHVSIEMDPTKALTLYRVAQPGLPTMVLPPSK